MKSHTENTNENKKESFANSNTELSKGTNSTFQFVDNRPEAVAQRKMKGMLNNSIQNKQAIQLQKMVNNGSSETQQTIQKKENNTGLPDNLKSGMENLSGMSMDDVKVHRNSAKPAQLQAHAYAQGTDIHLGPGQEKHLPHELGHVVQQKEGRVKPTMQMKGKVNVNDDAGLEKEADVMGAEALRKSVFPIEDSPRKVSSKVGPMQLMTLTIGDIEKENKSVMAHKQKENDLLGISKPGSGSSILGQLTNDSKKEEIDEFNLDEDLGNQKPNSINIPDKWGGALESNFIKKLGANKNGYNENGHAFGPRKSHEPTESDQEIMKTIKPNETLRIVAHGSEGQKIGGYTGVKMAKLLIKLGLDTNNYRGRIDINGCHAAFKKGDKPSFIEELSGALKREGLKGDCEVRGIKGEMTSVAGKGAKEGDTEKNAEHRNTMKAVADPLKVAVKELKRIEEAIDKDNSNQTLLDKLTYQTRVVNTLREKYTTTENETQSTKIKDAAKRNWYKSLNGKEQIVDI